MRTGRTDDVKDVPRRRLVAVGVIWRGIWQACFKRYPRGAIDDRLGGGREAVPGCTKRRWRLVSPVSCPFPLGGPVLHVARRGRKEGREPRRAGHRGSAAMSTSPTCRQPSYLVPEVSSEYPACPGGAGWRALGWLHARWRRPRDRGGRGPDGKNGGCNSDEEAGIQRWSGGGAQAGRRSQNSANAVAAP